MRTPSPQLLRKGFNSDAVHNVTAGAFVPPPTTAAGEFVQAIKFKSGQYVVTAWSAWTHCPGLYQLCRWRKYRDGLQRIIPISLEVDLSSEAVHAGALLLRLVGCRVREARSPWCCALRKEMACLMLIVAYSPIQVLAGATGRGSMFGKYCKVMSLLVVLW